jgi:hypothetical protein
LNRAVSLTLLLVLVLLAAWPLLQPYQVGGHSAYVDLSRAAAFHEGVTAGDLTPRWIPDFYNRHGSPIFNFYAPLTYYVIEALRLMGLDAMWALKITYLLFWLAAMLGMYFLAAEAIDRDGATAAAAAYAVAPYLLVDLYVRVGIAEFACFAWLPWLLWALRRAAADVGRVAPLVTAVCFAGLILTHNITAMIFTPLALAWVFFVAPEWRGAGRAYLALALGLGVATFFWLPALAEVKYVHAHESLTGGFFSYGDHFLAPGQLFLRFWGYGSSRPGTEDGMGFMFGEVLWLAVLAVPLLLARPKTRQDLTDIHLPLFASGAALLCLAMTQAFMKWAWDLLPLISFVQFPWRFLLPASFFGALALATLPRLFHRTYRPYVSWALAALAVLSSAQFFQARYVFQNVENNAFAFVFAENADLAAQQPQLVRPDRFLNMATIRALGITSTAGNDYLPLACREVPNATPDQAAEPADERIEVLSSRWGFPDMVAEVQAEVQSSVVFNQFFFPGWRARVDGMDVPLHVAGESGRMKVTVTPGRHLVEVEFGDTLVRLAAKLISALCLAGLVLWGVVILRFESR